MSNDIYLIGEVGEGITLDGVIKAVEQTDKTKPLNAYIHSGGGSVYEGLAIYNYLKGLDQEVNTISSGLVASIASVFFLAGKKENRKVNSTDSFLIHLPMGVIDGNAKDFEKGAKELRDIEDKISNIYVNETSLTKEEAMELMKKDEMLPVNFLKEKGFVSEIIEFKAVAKLNTNNNKNMDKKQTEQFDTFFSLMEKKFKGYFKKEPTNKIVQDSNGNDIDFPDVAEDGTPAVGDSATIDGAKAEGDVLMPNGETFVFVDGTLDSITEVSEDSNEELEAAKKKIEDLQATIEASNKLAEDNKTEITTVTNLLKEVNAEFKDFKNTITSGESPSGKRKGNEEKGEQTRSLFKKK